MKSIVLASGGVDSTALLIYLKDVKEVSMLFFNYGQISYGNEKSKLIEISKKLNTPLIEIDIKDSLKFSNSTLLNQKKNKEFNFEVEARNYLFISTATSIALQLFPEEEVDIFIGLVKNVSGWKDCSTDFINIVNKTAQYLSSNRINIKAPFINFDKNYTWDIIKNSKILSLKDTWSCYSSGEEPCGKCFACLDRSLLENFSNK